MGRSRGPSGPGGYDPAQTYMPCLYSLKPDQWRSGSVEANRIISSLPLLCSHKFW
ncbi:hypothetical protein M6B38_266825 [Iris pallida]|uniref:Uncharacterized protein n=1 Tax=Iris pallida TaxID=29817 RepID=A0AAX6IA30_IRIPA|nr:hypothetical protein M6B38_266825 [Iris pallida]